MRIRIDEEWPFFNLYHDKKYIQSHDRRKNVALREKESLVSIIYIINQSKRLLSTKWMEVL